MRRLALLALLTLAGCECLDYVPERGRGCRYPGQALMIERTSPLAPPLAVCRCPLTVEAAP